MTWASSYWTPFPELSAITTSAFGVHKNMTDVSDDPKYTPAISRMTAEELQDVAYPQVADRIGNPRHISLDTYKPLCQRALFDTQGAWERVSAVLLWGDMSCSFCPWAAKALSEMLGNPVVNGEQRRNIHIARLPHANHFVSAILKVYTYSILEYQSIAPL